MRLALQQCLSQLSEVHCPFCALGPHTCMYSYKMGKYLFPSCVDLKTPSIIISVNIVHCQTQQLGDIVSSCSGVGVEVEGWEVGILVCE